MKPKLPQSPPSNGSTLLAVKSSKVRLRRAYGVALISAMALAGTAQAAQTIGDFVWNDLNSNDIQDPGEPGVPGVQVNLFDNTTGKVVASTVTNTSGNYSFNPAPGEYVLEFILPLSPLSPNLTFVNTVVGNPALDSNVTSGPNSPGTTEPFTVVADVPNLDLDAGVKIPANTLVYCDGLGPLSNTNFSKNYQVPQFNSLLGTLTGARTTYYLATVQEIKAENTGSGIATINEITRKVVGTFTNPTTPNTSVNSLATIGGFDLPAFDGTLDYGGTSGISSGLLAESEIGNRNFASPFSAFVGSSTVTFPFTATASFLTDTEGGNVTLAQTTSATAGVCVVYKYTPLAQNKDFGDLPDTKTGTAPGTTTTPPDYQTTVSDGGPSHAIVTTPNVFLGSVKPDTDSGTLQNNLATADDLNPVAGPDDEEGLATLPTVLVTTTGNITLSVKVTNTSIPATLAGWIDFNHDGIFSTGESVTVTVPAAAGNPTVPLIFTVPTGLTVGPVGVRLRISTDPLFTGNPQPIGSPANDGEVEDYLLNISPGVCTLSAPLTNLPALPPKFNGLQFTVNGTASGLTNIASLVCPKTTNIDVAGMLLVPGPANPVTGPTGSPPSWFIATTPTPSTSLHVEARRLVNPGSGSLACTVYDSAGNACSTDPIIEQAVRVKGQAVTTAVLDNGKPVSASFRFVKIENDAPGLDQLEFNVNGKKFKLTALKDNSIYFLDISSALRSDVPNNVTFTAKGKPGGGATVFVADEPLQ